MNLNLNLSITKKFLFLLMPLGVGGTIVSVVTWNTLNHGNAELASAQVAHQLSLKSRAYVSEMGGALKGYLLNPKDARELEKKKAADDNNAQALEKLKSLVKNPETLKVIAELAEFDEKKLNPVEDEVMEFAKNGKIKEAQDTFVTKYLPLREKYDEISGSLTSKAEEESARQVQAVEESSKAAAIRIISVLSVILAFVSAMIAWTVRNLARSLGSTVEKMSAEAQQLSQASSQITHSGELLSTSAQEQSAAVQETMAAIEEVSAMVDKNAANAGKSREASENSQNKANQGQEVVSEMISSIQKISDGNGDIVREVEENNRKFAEIVQVIQEIGSKTRIINDIVFQTKLLSFNASVEAARAGEHGKGFAVVAEEVGNLATMSGNAAKEISDMLDSSVRKVEGIVTESKTKLESIIDRNRLTVQSGSETANRCGDVLKEIVQQTVFASQIAAEIASASGEQAQGVQEIKKAITQLDQVAHQNSTSATESATAAARLSAQSDRLRDVVHGLAKVVQGGAERSLESAPSNVISIASKSKAEKARDPEILSDADPRFREA